MGDQTSIQKGDSLEKKCFELLSEMLSNDDFFVSGKKSKIFWKKAYYSEKRKGNIIFDVTIETYLSGASNYSLLTIFECKNLKKKVTVDDVEEFNSKISEVGEHNTKGVIVTTSHFQEGAYNYAVSQKLGLVRITSNDKFDWINYRKVKTLLNISPAELFNQFVGETNDTEKFIATVNNKGVNNFADLLLEYGVIDFYVHKEKFINIPFVPDKRIDEIIDRLNKRDLHSGLSINFEKLCTFLQSVYPVSFDFETQLKDNILGKIEFDPVKISVSKSLKTDLNRWRFTLAHEIGHLILHSTIFKDKLSEKTDNEFSLSFRNFITEMTSRRIELQANIFASHLLLPYDRLSKVISRYFINENIHRGYLFLDNQPVNQRLVFTLLTKISSDFGVSIEVAKIRLIRLGLLHDDTDISLKTILKKLGLT
jgi:Zn-dependent peptidase ImmA (M78 family)